METKSSKIKTSGILVILLLFLYPVLASGQVRDSLPQKIDKKKLITAISVETAAYTAGISYLQFIWYHDHQRVPFHFYNDNKAYLQVDKFGHVYGSYIESYIGYEWLRSAGVKKGPALLLGGTLGILLQAPIEIFDGIYDGWGFSAGDFLANMVGSGFVIGQELIFDDQLFKYKWSYSESIYAPMSNGYLGPTRLKQVFGDYNGHTYWLSIPLKSIVPTQVIPPWLCFSLGYSANGMFGKYENITSWNGVAIPPTERYRQYLLSMDIDWTKIKTDSKFLQGLFKALVFIKLPFPAIEFNSLGKFRGYWLYY